MLANVGRACFFAHLSILFIYFLEKTLLVLACKLILITNSFYFSGEYSIPKSQFPECCWNCAKCSGKSFTNTSHMTNCVDCPHGTWPTADHSDCRPIEPSYLHWNEAWAVVIVFLSLFGLAVVVCTCAIFINFRGTAVVRAASRQLCQVLLLGIAMFYVTPLHYIVKPSRFSCRLLPFMFGLCFVLVVGKSVGCFIPLLLVFCFVFKGVFPYDGGF